MNFHEEVLRLLEQPLIADTDAFADEDQFICNQLDRTLTKFNKKQTGHL